MSSTDPPPLRREPLLNAPPLVLAAAGSLLAAHLLVGLLPAPAGERLLYDWALHPARFLDPEGYSGAAHRYATLVSHAFLHGGWMHLLVNAAMLLALGSPLARRFGSGPRGLARWLFIYLASVVGGALAFLLLLPGPGDLAVGASGGVSGLWAAVFLMGPAGGVRSPLDAGFVSATAAFAIANLAMIVIGPALAGGGGVAWEAHAGGYIAGAAAMLLAGRGGRALAR